RHTRFSRDWSSDVCSSDLAASAVVAVPAARYLEFEWFFWRSSLVDRDIDPLGAGLLLRLGCMLAALSLTAALLALVPRGSGAVKIGRASCRESGYRDALTV